MRTKHVRKIKDHTQKPLMHDEHKQINISSRFVSCAKVQHYKDSYASWLKEGEGVLLLIILYSPNVKFMSTTLGGGGTLVPKTPSCICP